MTSSKTGFTRRTFSSKTLLRAPNQGNSKTRRRNSGMTHEYRDTSLRSDGDDNDGNDDDYHGADDHDEDDNDEVDEDDNDDDDEAADDGDGCQSS